MLISQTVKGMRDILPIESELREHLLGLLKTTYSSFGFSIIETPCVEHLENLTSKQGGENESLIFKIMKRGEKLQQSLERGEELCDSALRYDLTVPLTRYYANNHSKLPSPFKALQVGPVWRADRPQRGRYRQFTQCDIDILGDASNKAEIELIYATYSFLEKAGLDKCTVAINDRRILRTMAEYSGFREEDFDNVFITLDKLDKIGPTGVEAELLRMGYSEESAKKYLTLFDEFAAASDKYEYFLEKFRELDIAETIANLRSIVDAVLNISDQKVVFDFNPTLVRGMSYYTGVIFEIKADSLKGISIAGGGRYDDMVGKYTGKPVPACGFSIGFERMIDALLGGDAKPLKMAVKNAYLYSQDLPDADFQRLFKYCDSVRKSGGVALVLKKNKNAGYQKKMLAEENYAIHEIKTGADIDALN